MYVCTVSLPSVRLPEVFGGAERWGVVQSTVATVEIKI